MSFKNAQYIRNLKPGEPLDGARIYEALADLAQRTETVAQQVNGNTRGQPNSPPSVAGVSVSGQDGFLHVAIHDPNPIYRGIRYYIEHADNPHFQNAIPVALHDARNATIAVGNQSRYIRVASAYSSSAPSSWVYHGGAQPVAVSGGGSGPGPLFLPSQGSGTGAAGVGLQGPGIAPFRSANGSPPKR